MSSILSTSCLGRSWHDEIHEVLKLKTPTDFLLVNSEKLRGGLGGMQTLFFLIMGIVFSPSKMKAKRSFRRKLVTFIKMCTKTQNNRKKRSKRTNTTKSPEIKRIHGNKTACQRYFASFVLWPFCFVSILSLVLALLFCLFGRCCFYSGNQVSFCYFEFL